MKLIPDSLDYEKAPVLIVNAADINFEENEEDYEMLVTKKLCPIQRKDFYKSPTIYSLR